MRNDVSELLSPPVTTVAPRSHGGMNPYGTSADRPAEPVRSDPYAALREDADAREANEFALPSLSSLSSLRPTEETERVVPPEPVLSEAVLVAAGLLEGPLDEKPADGADQSADPAAAAVASDDTALMAAAPEASLSEVTFADFLHDDSQAAADEDADLTEIFAGLEPVEVPTGLWRRGEDDVIGAGTTASRSAKRRSLRLRRKAA